MDNLFRGGSKMPYNSHFQRKRLILNIINHLGPISRTALIELTDYRPATVGAIASELIAENLIVEIGTLSAGHGRKRVLLDINKSHICAIGISFTNTSVTYILSQFDGQILSQSETSMAGTEDMQEMVQQIRSHIKELIHEHHGRNIVGIGICRPPQDPTNYHNPDFSDASSKYFDLWIQDSLKPLLEQSCNLPVKIYSDATLPVIAERRFGEAKDIDDFITVELSNGIGTSMFCNGAPVGGANGVAGELGHTVISFLENEKLCYCGKPGCIEGSTAWPALLGEIQNALDGGVFSILQTHEGDISVKDIKNALDAGDRMCMHIVKRAANRIGIAISNVINLLNPKMVVLYGFMLEMGEYFIKQMEQSIRENVISFSSDFEIRISSISDSMRVLGAVADIFSSYLHANDYKWVYSLQPNEAEPLISTE